MAFLAREKEKRKGFSMFACPRKRSFEVMFTEPKHTTMRSKQEVTEKKNSFFENETTSVDIKGEKLFFEKFS